MQLLSAEQAAVAYEANNKNMESRASASGKLNKLRDKYHNDVDIVQKWRVSVKKGASTDVQGPFRAPRIVVLTQKFSDLNILAEHSFFYTYKDKDKYRYEPCLDFQNAGKPETRCPICKAAAQNLHEAKFPYIRMAMTVLMERIDEAGNTVAWDKKLLVAKSENYRNFVRVLSAAEKQTGGNIRGVSFRLTRGTEKTSASSGTPAIEDNGNAFVFIPEEWIQQVQQHQQPVEERSQDGKYVYKPVNWLTTPINLNNNMDIFNYSSEDELRKEFDPSYVHNFQQPVNYSTVPVAPVTQPLVGTTGLPLPTIAPVSQPVTSPINQGVAPSLPPGFSQPPLPLTTGVPVLPTTTGVPVMPTTTGIPQNTPMLYVPPVDTSINAPSIPAIPSVPIYSPASENNGLPALAQQRNLTPVAPSVQNQDDVPWE